ncbi:transposase [Moorena sp. SIO4A1]|uniref:transposase n=1 Tax=Moorena sp. SIO4A1 TaxID=2607835 RepID=UPI0025E5BA5D|nr:transposase [Moorena sp. SIO4A1]
MALYRRVEQILVELRPMFARQATFEWFVLLLWGVLLSTQPPAVTSYLNAIGISEGYYHQALHWFHSSAWRVKELCLGWGNLLREHPHVHQLRGKPVYIGDGIKVGKEGNKMPGVKRLHQESENVSKPEWIRGHYFGALNLLLGVGEALFAIPVVLEIQDGLKRSPAAEKAAQTEYQSIESQEQTLVDKMAQLCVKFMTSGSYVVLDAYFASGKVLGPLRAHNLHLISRVRINSVGHAPFCALPGKRGRGRPRKWGTPVKLQHLFEQLNALNGETVQLYGRWLRVKSWVIQLHWDSPDELVQFVLTQLPGGKQMILISSDLTLSAQEVIEAYGWRFKIEVCFRTLVHLLGGFCYRFWLKTMPSATQWPQDLQLGQYPTQFRQQVERKVEAFERLVNLNAIALGILQLLSLEMANSIWLHFPGWFRTVPAHGYPTEQIVRLTLQHQAEDILPLK